MKFWDVFKNDKSVKKNLVQNKARTSIKAYIKYAFEKKYHELKNEGSLEKLIDDVEMVYNEKLSSLQSTNHNADQYFNKEDQSANYINLALFDAYQEISNKITT